MNIKTERVTDRMTAFVLYAVIIVMVMFWGVRFVNYALDARFCYHFLLKWKTAIVTFRETEPAFPVFSGNNHVAYMDMIVRQIRRSNTELPASNTRRPYIYIPKTLTPFKDTPDMFILCFADKLIIYSMPHPLFTRLDRMIDDSPGMETGVLTGIQGKHKGTVIGLFKI